MLPRQSFTTPRRLGVVAALGSDTALAATAAASRRGRGQLDLFNIGMAGLALGGIAIWSMHFIGMLACQVHIGVPYRLLETLALLPALMVAVRTAETGGRLRAAGCAAVESGSAAGVVQWQNGSFPSFIRGFDSLHPLHFDFPRTSRKDHGVSQVIVTVQLFRHR
jgi:hypothetical protein